MKKLNILLLILLTTSQLFAAKPTQFERFKKNVTQTVSSFVKKVKKVDRIIFVGALVLIMGACFLGRGKQAAALERCFICRDELIRNTRTLDCKHTFHQNCINIWLGVSNICPQCQSSRKKPQKV